MSIIYRTSFVQLHHDPVGATLETEWLDFVNSEQLRSSLLEALRLGRQYRVRGWVANNTLLRTIRPADQDWIIQEWFPEFAKLAVQRLAIVESQDALNRMAIATIMQRATEYMPFETHYFAEAAQARRWAASPGMPTPAAAK
ncbi:hypothetical protein GCM10023172_22510 [Hymenobacter ginsengisoli]|uniref:STAS/SEC14 domain-containing protein n=1 Tax=Hymenobacter ginsengisoli TaxID=1051626 RepID=A0ABP8QHF5_9BACT|nr:MULTISPECIES: hypothetical protein [unclassified Hymenobacter]MBO2031985.1 hypothetical protein [Hymenobacter sp. BT559]